MHTHTRIDLEIADPCVKSTLLSAINRQTELVALSYSARTLKISKFTQEIDFSVPQKLVLKIEQLGYKVRLLASVDKKEGPYYLFRVEGPFDHDLLIKESEELEKTNRIPWKKCPACENQVWWYKTTRDAVKRRVTKCLKCKWEADEII